MKNKGQIENLIKALKRNTEYTNGIDRDTAIKSLEWVLDRNKGIFEEVMRE